MLAKERLVRLEETLEIEYEKLDEFEKELVLLAAPTQKFELKQRIKRDVLPGIHKHETEYLNLLNEEAGAFDIPEQQASQAIEEVTPRMKKNNEFRTWQEELRRQIYQWNNANKDESALLRGVQLDVAFKTWYQNRFNDLDKEERSFIEQSWELQQREIQQRKSEKQRFTIAVSVLTCLGIGVIGLIVLLNRQTLLITFIVANKQHLAGKNLDNFYIPKINFSQANLVQANLSNANLDGSNLSNANLQEARLYDTYAPNAQFQGANLVQANLSNANLNGSNLSNTNLQEARLYDTHAPNAQFQDANLSKVDLSNANLDGSNLSNANLEGAKLHYTYAQKAQFQDANLSKVDLSNADLKKADFSRAKLNGANFSNADMQNVNLQNTDLLQADFRGVQNLTIEQVKSAKNWDKALYDEDFAKKLGLK